MRAERSSRLHSDNINEYIYLHSVGLAVFRQRDIRNIEKEQGSVLTMKKPTVKPSCSFPSLFTRYMMCILDQYSIWT